MPRHNSVGKIYLEACRDEFSTRTMQRQRARSTRGVPLPGRDVNATLDRFNDKKWQEHCRNERPFFDKRQATSPVDCYSTSQVWYHQLARVCCNTTICAAFAGCTAYIATTRHGGSPPDHLFNAVLGGCVAACATSSVVASWAAAVIGTVAGLLYLGGVKLLVR